MKNSFFTLTFFPRKLRSEGNGEYPIYARITTEGQKTEFTIGRKVHPPNWDQCAQKSAGRSCRDLELNKYLEMVKHTRLFDCIHQNSNGLMEYRAQIVVFRKDSISHIARIITYIDIKKGKKPKLISLLTNDFDMLLEAIVAIYRRQRQIESLFKQIKQNFPLRYFYGESANAIKIQVWVTLIANLLLSVLQNKLTRRWSFSGLATMVRIVLMYYLNLEKFLNQPDADLKIMLADASESPPEETEN